MTLFSDRDERVIENLRIINSRFLRKPKKLPVRGERPAFALGGSAPTLVIAASNSPASTMAKADYICFGVDDHLMFQLAIQRMADGEGGRLLVCEGDYYFSDTVHLASAGFGIGLRIEGMGAGATRFHMTAAANVHMFRISHAPGIAWFPIELASFAMDGAKATQTSGSPAGIKIETNGGSSLTLSDVHAYDFRGYGVHSDRSARKVFIDRSRFETNTINGLYLFVEGHFQVTDTLIEGNTGAGIVADGAILKMKGCVVRANGAGGFSAGGIFESLGSKLLVGNEFVQNTGNGISLDGVNAALLGNYVGFNTAHGISAAGNEPLTITANVLDGNSQYGASLPTGGGNQGGVFAANVVKDNLQHGVYVGSPHWQVNNNRIEENGQATNNTYDGIILDANADDCEVLGNKIRQGAAGNKQRYGIHVVSGATNNWVALNRVHGTLGTAHYNLVDASTIQVVAGATGDNQ